MSIVRDHAFSTRFEAQSWLSNLPYPTSLHKHYDYPHGPIFECVDPESAIDFLLKCAAQEEHDHSKDDEMEGMILTIQFEFGSMAPEQLELVFAYSHAGDQGSVSFSLSTKKLPDGSFQVFGDEKFQHLK